MSSPTGNSPLPPISAGKSDNATKPGSNKLVLSAATVTNGIKNAVADSESRIQNTFNRNEIQFFDYNFQSAKKVVSSALLDVALLMANISQLKAVYLAGYSHVFYIPLLVLLIISIVLQIAAGLLLIWLGRININEPDPQRHKQAEVLANVVVVLIFLLTIINIIVSSIGISDNVPYTALAALNGSL